MDRFVDWLTSLINNEAFSTSTLETLKSIAGHAFDVIIIIAVTYFLLHLRKIIIDRIFEITKLPEYKEKTLTSILMSLTRYVIYIFAFLMVLQALTIDITPLLAGAGVASLAIGFGAQNLIKDLFNGFFIAFEDQYRVGDFVEINDSVSGTVEEVGLRLTAIREWSGKKFFISNSEIKTIRNYNREKLRAIVSATFAYEEKPVEIRRVLEEVCTEVAEKYGEHLLKDNAGNFLEPPQIYGVTDLGDAGGKFTLIALTKPESIWTVEKALREIMWQKSLERDIKITYPHHILHNIEAAQAQKRENIPENKTTGEKVPEKK